MRRRPRLNSDIKLRATFLRCTAAAFFGGGSVFEGVPHSGGHRPIERQRKNQDEPVEPIGALDLAGLEIEPPGLEVREHRLDAPAQAVVARTPWRSRARPGVGRSDIAMIHGSAWPSACTMATWVRARFPVSAMSSNLCSPRAKHSAKVVSPPLSNTRRSCLQRSRQPQP